MFCFYLPFKVNRIIHRILPLTFWINNTPGRFLKQIQIYTEFPRVAFHWMRPSVPPAVPSAPSRAHRGPENVSDVPQLVSNRARFRRGSLSPSLNCTCPLPNLPVVCALNFLWLMMSSNVSFKWQIDHNAKDKLATSLPCEKTSMVPWTQGTESKSLDPVRKKSSRQGSL